MKKEYPLDIDIRRTLLTGAFLVLGLREIVLIIIIFFDWRPEAVTYVLLLLGMISCLYYLLQAYTERIVVSSTDLVFQMIGQSISIKWEDMDRINRTKFLSIRYDAIFAPKDKAIVKGFPVYRKEVSVNLHRYSENWRESELGQQIKEYAPHLFR